MMCVFCDKVIKIWNNDSVTSILRSATMSQAATGTFSLALILKNCDYVDFQNKHKLNQSKIKEL